MKYNTITGAISHGGLAPKARVSRLSADQIYQAISHHVHRAVQLELTHTLPEQLRHSRHPGLHGRRRQLTGSAGYHEYPRYIGSGGWSAPAP